MPCSGAVWLSAHAVLLAGGSTCIMLTQKGRLEFDEDALETAVTGVELLVQMGQQIGKTK